MLRRWFFDKLLSFLEKELSDTPKVSLSKEEYDGLLSALWQNPAFRKYIADRDAKLIWTMAGGEGLEPEPRDKYSLHAGQRFENLILGREAKQAFVRTERQRSVLAKAQEQS